MVLNFNSVSFEAQKNRENGARQLKYYQEHEKKKLFREPTLLLRGKIKETRVFLLKHL